MSHRPITNLSANRVRLTAPQVGALLAVTPQLDNLRLSVSIDWTRRKEPMPAKGSTQPQISHRQCNQPCAGFPDIEPVISDPTTRDWLKTALIGAIVQDTEEVAIEPEVLASILVQWANHQIRLQSPRALWLREFLGQSLTAVYRYWMMHVPSKFCCTSSSERSS